MVSFELEVHVFARFFKSLSFIESDMSKLIVLEGLYVERGKITTKLWPFLLIIFQKVPLILEFFL